LPKALGTSFIKKYESKSEYREKVTSLLWLEIKKKRPTKIQKVGTNLPPINPRSISPPSKVNSDKHKKIATIISKIRPMSKLSTQKTPSRTRYGSNESNER
jgi:hypothetical protein